MSDDRTADRVILAIVGLCIAVIVTLIALATRGGGR